MPQETCAFLARIFPEPATIAICYGDPNPRLPFGHPDRWTQGQISTDDVKAIERAVRRADKRDVYFTPCPQTPGKRARGREIALPGWVVWADCDKGLTGEHHTWLIRQGATLVRSGGITKAGARKFHVYFHLDKATDPRLIECLNHDLVVVLGGDPAPTHAAAVLRLPGTYNHKYDQPRSVELDGELDQ